MRRRAAHFGSLGHCFLCDQNGLLLPLGRFLPFLRVVCAVLRVGQFDLYRHFWLCVLVGYLVLVPLSPSRRAVRVLRWSSGCVSRQSLSWGLGQVGHSPLAGRCWPLCQVVAFRRRLRLTTVTFLGARPGWLSAAGWALLAAAPNCGLSSSSVTFIHVCIYMWVCIPLCLCMRLTCAVCVCLRVRACHECVCVRAHVRALLEPVNRQAPYAAHKRALWL